MGSPTTRLPGLGKPIPALELNPRAENELRGVGKCGKSPHEEKTFPLFSTRTVS